MATRAEQRIAIAKDVIAQLIAGRFLARTGHFIDFDDEARGKFAEIAQRAGAMSIFDLKELDAQSVIQSLPRCEGCARGGLLIAAIDRFDKLMIRSLHQLSSIAGDSKNEYLLNWFTRKQLLLIERAFESWRPNPSWANHDDPVDLEVHQIDGSAWGRAYRNKTDRMDAIMRSIVSNGGIFNIERIPRPRKTPISKLKRTLRKAGKWHALPDDESVR